MTTLLHSERTRGRGFTLIELLIVIAIIGVLATLLLPVGGAIKESARKKRARTELTQIETAIDRYKTKNGFYPPDNPGNPLINQLYFELMGTTLNNDLYETLDNSARIRTNDIPTTFGPKVVGFMNANRSGAGEDVQKAEKFLPGLLPSQTYELQPDVRILISAVQWPDGHAFQPLPSARGKNPWRYNSSSPTNNPNSYDLWLDIISRGKTNRISNWSKQPQIVP